MSYVHLASGEPMSWVHLASGEPMSYVHLTGGAKGWITVLVAEGSVEDQYRRVFGIRRTSITTRGVTRGVESNVARPHARDHQICRGHWLELLTFH